MVILGNLPGPPAPKREVALIILIAPAVALGFAGLGVLAWWILPPV